MIEIKIRVVECEACGGHANVSVSRLALRDGETPETEAEQHLVDLINAGIVSAMRAHAEQRAAIVDAKLRAKAAASSGESSLEAFAADLNPPTNDRLN